MAPGRSRRAAGGSNLAYSLVVSRGYVRLVRTGTRPSRRFRPRSFVFNGDDWEEVDREPEPPDPDDVDPGGDDTDWGGLEPLDPDVQMAIDDAAHPRRGDAGQSARSRMNMRRLFVSLPWELVGPRPALISAHLPRRLAAVGDRRPGVGGASPGVRAQVGPAVG